MATISLTNKNEFMKNDSPRIPAHEYTFADATTVNACRPYDGWLDGTQYGIEHLYIAMIWWLPTWNVFLKDPECIPAYIQRIKPFELKCWSKLKNDRSTCVEIPIC
jgi:hypothetical protein